MVLKAAFIFMAPEADAERHRSVIITPEVELTTVGVKNYADAVSVAKALVNDGMAAIELCGGFGAEGTALVKKAVGSKVAVGVVRFDNHPLLEGKSGDELFSV